jgi:hypothetical protein
MPQDRCCQSQRFVGLLLRLRPGFYGSNKKSKALP